MASSAQVINIHKPLVLFQSIKTYGCGGIYQFLNHIPMKKLQRPIQHIVLDILVLCLIFLIAFFLSKPLFEASYTGYGHKSIEYSGMALIGITAVLTTFIIWENVLFPLRFSRVDGGVRVRNPVLKNTIQAILYMSVQIILLAILYSYPVREPYFQYCFIAFAGIPILHKIISSIRSDSSFLKLTGTEIWYRNRRKRGRFELKKIQYIRIIRGAGNSISKLRLGVDNSEVTIDLDEMNVARYNDGITDYIKKNYTTLLKY